MPEPRMATCSFWGAMVDERRREKGEEKVGRGRRRDGALWMDLSRRGMMGEDDGVVRYKDG